MLARLETTTSPPLEQQFTFEFLEPTAKPYTLLELKDLSFGYADQLILNKTNLKITSDTRIGLLGRNGAGKSTLLKILAGVVQANTGLRETNEKLNIGYFTQHRLDHLDANKSPIEHFQELDPKASLQKIRNFLAVLDFRVIRRLLKLLITLKEKKRV